MMDNETLGEQLVADPDNETLLRQLAVELNRPPWELFLLAAGEPWPVVSPLEVLGPAALEQRMLSHLRARSTAMEAALLREHLTDVYGQIIKLHATIGKYNGNQKARAKRPRIKIDGVLLVTFIERLLSAYPDLQGPDLWDHFITEVVGVEGMTGAEELQVTYKADSGERHMTRKQFLKTVNEIQNNNRAR